MTKLDKYTVRMILGMLGAILGLSLGNMIGRILQEPKTPQYIVVEYSPECDCYRVVEILEEMKGIENNE